MELPEVALLVLKSLKNSLPRRAIAEKFRVRTLCLFPIYSYHLNFLLENSIVVKDGVVYRLTDKGRAIAQFVKEVNQIWQQIQPKLGGGYMDIVGYAEEFEKEISIKMHKQLRKES